MWDSGSPSRASSSFTTRSRSRAITQSLSALFVTGVEQFGQGPRLPPAQKSDQHVGARSRCDIAELDLAGADSLLDHDKTTAVHRDGSRGYFKRQRSWAGSAHGIHLDGQCGGYLA